jgi:hypothetical protein
MNNRESIASFVAVEEVMGCDLKRKDELCKSK